MSDFNSADDRPTGTILERVKVPAIFLVIAGGLNLLVALWLLVDSIRTASIPEEDLKTEFRARFEKLDPETRQKLLDMNLTADRMVEMVLQAMPFTISWGVASVLLASVTILGGVRMGKQRSHGLAVMGAVLVSIPCLSPLGCCLLGEAVGIWCLIVLLSNDVRAAFANASAPAERGPLS